jgi:glutamine synthetase
MYSIQHIVRVQALLRKHQTLLKTPANCFCIQQQQRGFRQTAGWRSAEDVETLQSSLAKQGVKYALASYVDIHGVAKSKMVPLAHLPRMLKGSELCTGAALDGVPQDVSDEEVSPIPDTNSVIVCPWGNRDVAWFASDLYCEGKKFEPCSRNILKRVLAEAEDMGFRFDLGIEPEFFILKPGADGSAISIADRDVLAKPAYDVRTTLDSLSVLSSINDALAASGFDGTWHQYAILL